MSRAIRKHLVIVVHSCCLYSLSRHVLHEHGSCGFGAVCRHCIARTDVRHSGTNVSSELLRKIQQDADIQRNGNTVDLKSGFRQDFASRGAAVLPIPKTSRTDKEGAMENSEGQEDIGVPDALDNGKTALDVWKLSATALEQVIATRKMLDMMHSQQISEIMKLFGRDESSPF